jgi:phosphoribosylformylglycinamidine synthase
VSTALPRLGYVGITEVRQGKRFELELEGELTDSRLTEIHDLAEKVLSNPVIEDYTVEVPALDATGDAS